MCFSAEVSKEIERVMKQFRAEQDLEEAAKLNSLIIKGDDTAWAKEALGLARKPVSNPFKTPQSDCRIYPGYFAQVLVEDKGKKLFRPMRYRVRPHGSNAEIPTKFNVFNARLDSLELRQTWNPLFGTNHGIFPFTRFFEWVEHNGEKRQISFKSERHELLWAPCLWDYWFNEKESVGFYSFAMITDDPPPEIEAMGHDRCPIFLRADQIDAWLSPKGKSKDELYSILQMREQVVYSHEWLAA